MSDGLMRNSLLIISFAVVIAVIVLIPTMGSDDGNKEFVIIHTGDTHGMVGGDRYIDDSA